MSSDSDEPEWVAEQASSRVEAPSCSSNSSPINKWDNDSDDEVVEETAEEGALGPSMEAQEKRAPKKNTKGPPATELPLVIATNVKRDMILVEAVDPELDLSGDFGCIGRLHVNTRKPGAGASQDGRGALTFDLKGRVYEGDVVPTNSTLCMVSIDGNNAKIDTVFTDFVQLSAPRSSIYDMETVRPELEPMTLRYFGDSGRAIVRVHELDTFVALAESVCEGCSIECRARNSPATQSLGFNQHRYSTVFWEPVFLTTTTMMLHQQGAMKSWVLSRKREVRDGPEAVRGSLGESVSRSHHTLSACLLMRCQHVVAVLCSSTTSWYGPSARRSNRADPSRRRLYCFGKDW